MEILYDASLVPEYNFVAKASRLTPSRNSAPKTSPGWENHAHEANATRMSRKYAVEAITDFNTADLEWN
jgi:hypothetical protein